MKKQTKQVALISQLNALANQPDEQRRSCFSLLEHECDSKQVTSAALAVLTRLPGADARPILHQLYYYYDESGVKRDPGGDLRSAILGALLPLADRQDQALAERAIGTYEFMPPNHEECTSGLRLAGLSLLNNFDPVLVGFHCTRLLMDGATSHMSGEPALTAARVLGELAGRLPYQGHLLPLYSYIFRARSHPEVEAECLRQLTRAPDSIIAAICAHYAPLISSGSARDVGKDDIALLGLFDLLIKHTEINACFACIEEFLRETQRYDLYHYVLTALLTQHGPRSLDLLGQAARGERDPRKIERLLSVLALVQHDPAVEKLARELQRAKWT